MNVSKNKFDLGGYEAQLIENMEFDVEGQKLSTRRSLGALTNWTENTNDLSSSKNIDVGDISGIIGIFPWRRMLLCSKKMEESIGLAMNRKIGI